MYSQNHEDDILMDVFKDRPNGRLLEIGAWQPIELSNSRRLIEEGWSAVLVELSPIPVYRLLLEYGNNSKVNILQAAIGLVQETVPFHISDDAISTSEEEQYEVWKNHSTFHGELFVPMITLESIADTFGHGFDFISFDTEGTSVYLFEQMIELGWEPKCVCVEHNGKIDEIMLHAGDKYCKIHENGENIILKLK